MITAAIICEYNPFHNGHLYQIERIKKELSADRIICIMSGDFVQRGEPAVLSKEIRTRMALECGADLVLLLPVAFATSAADNFAHAGVSILNRLGVVDYLCFGAECDDAETLVALSKKLSAITPENPDLKALLKDGMTFARAREALIPEAGDILDKPNNILALEYLCALNRLDSNIKPFIIKRTGAGYNDEELTSDGNIQSATALRKVMAAEGVAGLRGYIPDKALEPIPAGQFLFPGDLDTPLLDALLREDDLSLFTDVSKDLAERIKNNLSEYNGFEAFAEQLKTKNFTRARINRALLHILLNIREDSKHLKELSDTLTYVRILGFKKDSKDILKDIKTKGSIVPVTKIPDIYDDADPVQKRMLDSELYASTLYDRLLSLKFDIRIPQEYSKPCVMI